MNDDETRDDELEEGYGIAGKPHKNPIGDNVDTNTEDEEVDESRSEAEEEAEWPEEDQY